MNREELIKKWLDHDLNPEEQEAFETLEDYTYLMKLSSTISGFEAPAFNTENELATLKSNLPKKTKGSVLKPLLRIAAILLIGFSVYYYTTTLDTHFNTDIAQRVHIDLPDSSTAALNALSELTFNKKSWKSNREVYLNGEAFFKVAKGSRFDVKTDQGIVRVLGTEFNVKQRHNYFEVTCFEGIVAVLHNNKEIKLLSGQRFALIDGKTIVNEKETTLEPSWLVNESSFTSRPLKFVLNELERQYDITIDRSTIDDTVVFSGSFTHNNLDLALKSITLPLGLRYSITNTTVTLTSE